MSGILQSLGPFIGGMGAGCSLTMLSLIHISRRLKKPMNTHIGDMVIENVNRLRKMQAFDPSGAIFSPIVFELPNLNEKYALVVMRNDAYEAFREINNMRMR